MANEYLKRTPTSTGNRRVFTLSLWFKYTNIGADTIWFLAANPSKDNTTQIFYSPNVGTIFFFDRAGSDPTTEQVGWAYNFRDCGSWYNMLIHVDTTKSNPSDRAKCFINGKELQRDESKSLVNNSVNTNTPPQNQEFWRLNYANNVHYIGARIDVNFDTVVDAIFSDYFFVDGQALTPDVFGKYDEGKGYISAGTTQATDFKKGQWIPKAPAIIKSVINARGGFGVNGFYLPMNSANNYGADFHTTPNSILKLKENLPQPKAEIDGAGDYTNALRDDPFKQYLIYAQPNVSGGLQNGYGDYSHIIKGSGTPCTLTGGNQGTPAISTNQSTFYGSSLYFDGNDTINVETNNSNYLGQDFTIEFWVWHDAAYPINQMAFNTTPHTSFGISLNRGGSGQTALFIGNGSNWQFTDFRSGGRLYSQQWNHVVVERYNNTITIYHNGVGQGSFKAGETVVTNGGTFTGVMPTGFTSLFRYGTYENNAGEPLVGYIQDYRVYSGVAKYKGGFDVPKPYTPINFANWRAVPDTCQNNFATWNPLLKLGSPIFSFSDGNLKVIESGNLGGQNLATMGVSSGKWYYEVRWAGIVSASHLSGWSNFSEYNVNKSAWCRSSGQTFGDSGGGVGTFPVASNGDIINVAFDADSGKLWFGINGTYYSSQVSTTSLSEISQGNDPAVIIHTTGSGIRYFPIIWYDNVPGGGKEQFVNFGQNPSIGGNYTPGTFTDSNGKGLFKYEPPTGFLALCEDNLPTPTIKDPGEHFKTVLWTGDGAVSRNITGVGFKPDFVWIKPRNFADQHVLCDSIRGPLKSLYINTNSEAGNGVRGFNADGFTLNNWNNTNDPNDQYVAWCWKAGGPAVTNTDGTITSQVSANQTAGFSIVSYTGTGANATVGHGLGKTPKLIIVKNRDSFTEWSVLETMVNGETHYLRLNGNYASTITSIMWNNTNPTSEVFSVGTYEYVNENTKKHIAYCWAEIEGYSKFGSYVGNDSTDGPFVYCGFKPAFVLLKASSTTANWCMIDNARNPTNPTYYFSVANAANAGDDTGGLIDFVSNGFKLRLQSPNFNGNGVTYIFAAFAESPFQTANAK